MVAENIERYIRLQKDDPTDHLYHVCNHIKRSRVIKGTVEVLGSDFLNEEGTSIKAFEMLKLEQQLLDKATGDVDCLNNNEIAYTSGWIGAKALERFNRLVLEKRKVK